MTAEYLDRDSLVARMEYYKEHATEESGEHYAYLVTQREIRNAPACDVAPVVHGRFVHNEPMIAGGVDCWHCSRCRRLVTDVEREYFEYCPWCGARMDGDDDAKAD